VTKAEPLLLDEDCEAAQGTVEGVETEEREGGEL